jgi:predicted dehydrogenase
MLFRAMTAAVVGTGLIGPVHVEALKRAGVRVKGILGSSPEKSRAAARALAVETAYDDLDALLRDPDVAVVHLASPNRVHAAQVKAALTAGKHVICEKPLGMTSAETADLVSWAASHPKQICAVNYNIRFYPLCLEARARVRGGSTGEVFHVRGAYVQDWLLFPDDFNWRVLAEEGGATRAVGDIGTHWLDLIQFVTGLEVEAVLADLKTVHPVRRRPAGSVETFRDQAAGDKSGRMPVEISTEDYGSILLRFRGGARGVLTVSQVTAGRKNQLTYEIACAKAALAWDSERPNELWIGRRGGPNEILLKDPALLSDPARAHAAYPGGHQEGFPDTFKQLYRAVYADIERGEPSPEPLYATFADGHRELCLCEAILKSARTGTWTPVERAKEERT